MKQYHYEFDNKRTFETSYGTAFTGEKAISNPLSVEAKEDLRKFHFNLGTDQPDYKSIHQLEFDDKTSQADPPPQIDKNVIRKHNFILGTDPVNYQSTAKAAYVSQTNSQSRCLI